MGNVSTDGCRETVPLFSLKEDELDTKNYFYATILTLLMTILNTFLQDPNTAMKQMFCTH